LQTLNTDWEVEIKRKHKITDKKKEGKEERLIDIQTDRKKTKTQKERKPDKEMEGNSK
jgi:hypothetical protein